MRTPEEEAATIQILDPAVDTTLVHARLARALATRQYLQNVSQIGPQKLQETVKDIPFSSTENLNRLMIDLLAKEPLHEKPFTSTVPVLGPAIVAIRTVWNWISTRWYVLPIMHQQIQINQQMLIVLNELAQRQEVDAQRIAELEARLQER
jgi:hypothetical protein